MKFQSILEETEKELDVAVEKDRHVNIILSEANYGGGTGGGNAGGAPRGMGGAFYGTAPKNPERYIHYSFETGNNFMQIRHGSFRPKGDDGDYCVLWYIKGLKATTAMQHCGRPQPISCLRALAPESIEDLYGMLVARANSIKNVGGEAAENNGMQDPYNGKTQDQDRTGAFDIHLFATGNLNDPGYAVLNPKTGKPDKKYASMQQKQTMRLLWHGCHQPEGEGYLNNPKVISAFKQEDQKAFQQYYTDMANSRSVLQAIEELDSRNNWYIYNLLNPNNPIGVGNGENGGGNGGGDDSGGTQTPTEGHTLVFSSNTLRLIEDTTTATGPVPGISEPMQYQNAQNSEAMQTQLNNVPNQGTMNDTEKRRNMQQAESVYKRLIDELGDVEMHESLFPKDEYLKTAIRKFTNIDLKSVAMNGLLSLLSPRMTFSQYVSWIGESEKNMAKQVDTSSMSRRDSARFAYTNLYAATDGGKNLIYGMNHYPPSETGWGGTGGNYNPIKALLANILLSTDKELSMFERAQAFIRMFGENPRKRRR